MNLLNALGAKHNVIIDRRASKRDAFEPTEIVVESSYRVGDRAKQIDDLLRSDQIPVAFVDAQSNVWVLSAGGSGVIIFESADDKPLDDVQSDTIDAVVKAVESEFDLRKPKKKKKSEEVLLGVVEPEYPFEWPDIIADVEEEI